MANQNAIWPNSAFQNNCTNFVAFLKNFSTIAALPPEEPPVLSRVLQFVSKWQTSKLSERSASQSHFIDLCDVLGQDTPTTVDCDGSAYTFEKGLTKNSGGKGFADVWKRSYFAWEYKSKGKNLVDAYQRLLKYREALESPPLLVVCDFDRFEVHTNWTNTPSEVYAFCLQDLIANQPTSLCKVSPLDVLYSLFTDPAKLKPGRTTVQVTTDAAREFGQLAVSLRGRGIPAERAAHYIMRLLFCLFSEGVGLLPEHLFARLIEGNRRKPAEFVRKLRMLFATMSKGGSFGADDIPYFDGGLFMDDEAYELTIEDIGILARAARLDWAAIEPAIFGTLFERILDPDKRSQIGAHYTSKEDILLIIDSVLMEPLQNRWIEVQRQAKALLQKQNHRTITRTQSKLSDILGGFASEIASIRVLDPACGSGSFLYLALKRLLDLEKEISVFAISNGLSRFFVRCRPSQLYGIENNIYAHEVASVAVWIGFLQWQRDNGIVLTSNPIMEPLRNIRCVDAVLDYDKNGSPIAPKWPDSDVIVSNPPFLGDKKMRDTLGDKYVDDLRKLYKDRIPGGSDLVCYWFETARAMIESRRAERAGLLATQAIRGGANRTVLERIKQSGDIFWAQADRDWILEGASVHVSMIGFDNGSQTEKYLDGLRVPHIYANLTSDIDLASALRLEENSRLAFQGPVKVGPFDIDENTAKEMMRHRNPNGRPNSDVVKPLLNASDITGLSRNRWIIDFGDISEREAALYETPFEYLKHNVKPLRTKNRDKQRRTFWWRLGRSGSEFTAAKHGKTRVILTPRVSKHRIFIWMTSEVIPDSAVIAFARDDDYFFGVLQSRIHELWALRLGTALEDRPRYTATTTFETFPLPWSPSQETKASPLMERIATASRKLVQKRNIWLNPTAETAEELKKRTLTKLYNENPTWLQDAHRELDQAVLAAYGWPENLSDSEILARLLHLNAERSSGYQAPPKKVAVGAAYQISGQESTAR